MEFSPLVLQNYKNLMDCLRETLVNLCANADYFDAEHPTVRVFTNHISFQKTGSWKVNLIE